MNCPFCFFTGKQASRGLFSGKRKIKKAFSYIHLTNWLVSTFFHYKFPFLRSHLVWKIENLMTNLPPRLCLGYKIVTRFSFSKLVDSWKTENYCVKTFCSHHIWQIYITKYYFLREKTFCPCTKLFFIDNIIFVHAEGQNIRQFLNIICQILSVCYWCSGSGTHRGNDNLLRAEFISGKKSAWITPEGEFFFSARCWPLVSTKLWPRSVLNSVWKHWGSEITRIKWSSSWVKVISIIEFAV